MTRYIVLHFPEDGEDPDMDKNMFGTPSCKGIGTHAITEALYGATLIIMASRPGRSEKQYLVRGLRKLRSFPDFCDYGDDEIVKILGCLINNALIITEVPHDSMLVRGTTEAYVKIMRNRNDMTLSHELVHLVPPHRYQENCERLSRIRHELSFPGKISLLTTPVN